MLHLEDLESAFAMVKMLLDHNLDANQRVGIHGGRTVWESYVYFIFDNNLGDEWRRKIAWLLIDHGAQHTADRVWSVDHKKAPRSNLYDDVVEVAFEKSDQYASYSVVYMLKELFGHDEARAMQKAIMANGQNQSWWTWLSETLWLPARNRSPEVAKNFVWEDMSNTAEL